MAAITAAEINELPAGNRSYMAFVGNVPGAQLLPTTGFLNDTMLANGQTAAANNVVFDGAGNVDDLRGSNVGGQTRVANDSVQEVQVLTNQHTPSSARVRAVINAVTKSGTNQIMGTAFDYFTGPNVTAKDYFTKRDNLEKPEVSKSEAASADRSSGTSCISSPASNGWSRTEPVEDSSRSTGA